MKPSDFAKIRPWNSTLQNYESETIAKNIMVILADTGDEFRAVSWEEYKARRIADGGFNEWKEKNYFDAVIPYMGSLEGALIFCPNWLTYER